MELSPQETSRVWWRGTIKGALKGLLIGAVIGAATALTLSGAGILFEPLIPVFSGFITMSGGFSMVPLAVSSGVSGMLANVFHSGDAAVNAYHQERHNAWQQQQDAKLNQLEGREQALEEHVSKQSTVTNGILARGARNTASFTEAETARQNAPTSPTIH